MVADVAAVRARARVALRWSAELGCARGGTRG
jgi:hypothetical protein